jgi:hypothetical protein
MKIRKEAFSYEVLNGSPDASAGEIGQAKDFYFDDQKWTAR